MVIKFFRYMLCLFEEAYLNFDKSLSRGKYSFEYFFIGLKNTSIQIIFITLFFNGKINILVMTKSQDTKI